MKRHRLAPKRPRIEELEPRLLYSVDFAPALADALAPQAEQRVIGTNGEFANAADSLQQVQHASHEVVFVDTRVSNYQQLIDDIKAGGNPDRQIDIVMLDPNRDGIAQISTTLSQYKNLDAVHLIAHGSDGSVDIGDGQLDFESLIRNQEAISAWGNAFTANGDFLIYGCNVAATQFGQGFVDYFSSLTHTDVAASSDATGNAALGGDWVLEYQTGMVQTQLAVSEYNQQSWDNVLAITSNGTVTSAFTSNATSLTWSHTVAAGTNRALFVEIAIDGLGANVTSVKFGSASLTQVGRSTGNHAVEIWALVNPTASTANVVVTFAGSTAAAGGATTFNGVDQTTPYGVFAGATGTSATASVTVSSATGDQVIDAQYWRNTSSTTDGSGQTAQWAEGDPTILGGSTIKAGATSVTMSGTNAASTEWEIGAVSIKAANAAPTATNLNAAETYTEDTGLNLTNIVISDIDSPNVTATLTLSNVAAGSFNTGTSGAVTSAYNAGTGVWSASGAIANVNTLLAGLIFTPGLNFNSNFTIATSVSDGVAAAITGSKAMTGAAVNDAPTATITPLAYTATEQVALTLDGTGLSIADVDAGSASVQATLAVDSGVLNAGAGFTGVSVSGSGTATLILSGTISQINNLLSGGMFSSLAYTANSDAPPASAVLTLTVDDLGNVGAGGALTGSDTATINIAPVNDAPVLNNAPSPTLLAQNENSGAPVGAVGTLVSALVDFAAPSGQLDNVTDPDSGALLGIAITAVDTANGTWHYSTDGGTNWNTLGAVANNNARLLAADANTRIYFQPNANFNGTLASAITFRAWDQTSGSNGSLVSTTSNGGSTAFSAATDTASLLINAVNDAPTATNLNAAETYTEDTALNLTNIVVSDIDSANVTVTLTLSDVASGSLNIATSGAVTSSFAGGVWTASGAIANVNTLLAGLIFTPGLNFNSNFSIATSISDGVAAPITGSKAMTGTAVNDEQVIGLNTGITVAENSSGTVITPAMLTTTDVDHTAAQLVYTLTTAPVNGTLRLGGVALALSDTFTQSDINSGLLGYDHNGSETASDNFNFSVDDGLGTASTGTFNISVTPVNDNIPTITSNGGAANAAINVAENSTAVTTVTATDADLPAQTLTYSISGGADAGRFTINSSTGALSFAVPPDFEAPADVGLDNVYQVIVQVSDGALTDTQTLSVTVTPLNDNTPVSTPVTLAPIAEDSGARVVTQAELLANATDADGDSLAATNLAISSGTGSLLDNGDGTWTYNPALNDDTAVSFSYTVSDGSLTAAAAATLDMTPVNDAPTASDTTINAAEDTVYSGNLPAASDADGDVVGCALNIQGSHGTATVNADGSFTYAPAANFNGSDSFTFTLDDGNGGGNTYTVTVNVAAANDAPVLASNTLSITEGTTVILDSTNLNATDVEQGPAQLTYTVSNLTQGQFEWVATPGAAITSFTQADIDAGRVMFVHDASDFAPTYDVSLSDGSLSTGPQAAAINFSAVNEGINVAAVSGSSTTEAGGSVTFDVSLNSQPFSDVTLFIVSSNPAEGTASVSSLTFTASNWNVTRQVTVTGVNDFVDDGDQAYSIQLQAATSTDRNYNGLDAGDVALSNRDDDTAGITMTPVSGLTTDESGASDTFSVVLTSRPLADVVIDMSSSNMAEGVLSASALVFTPGNWNIPQTVLVSGVADTLSDGNRMYQAVAAPASSADPLYNGMMAGAVDVMNRDVTVPSLVEPVPMPPMPPVDEAGAPEAPEAGAPEAPAPGTPETAQAATPAPGGLLPSASGWAAENDRRADEAVADSGLKTSAPKLIEPVHTQRETLTDPAAHGNMLLRLLDIIHAEYALADTGNNTISPAIHVEIAQDEAFFVEVLSQGARITTVTLSIGAVWWALRAGGLMTSLLTSLPAWRTFDVLPVLGRDEGEEDDASWGFDADEDGQHAASHAEEQMA